MSRRGQPKVLVASLVRNRAWILPKFLEALKSLQGAWGFYFLVNDSEDDSFRILWETCIGGDPDKPLWPRAVVGYWDLGTPEVPDHHWGPELFVAMQKLRERVLDYARRSECDYLLFVDSDVIVRADTITRLLSHRKDFVAATVPNAYPNEGSLTFVNACVLEEANLSGPAGCPVLYQWRAFDYRRDGLVKVGATGACMLISRRCFESCHYTYEPVTPVGIKLLSKTLAEDLVFAVSCLENGFEQFLDTEYVLVHNMLRR